MAVTFTPWSPKRLQKILASLAWRFTSKTIDITQEDIDNGLPKDSQLCPAALAARRIFPNAKIIQVGKLSVCVTDKNDIREEWAPDDSAYDFLDGPLSKFVHAVDHSGGHPEPQSIVLHLRARYHHATPYIV